MFRKLSLALLASAAILPSSVHAEIGSVAAVNRDMDGTPPAGDRRALDLGNRVVKDELIQTSKLGSGQLMLLDQTTLTVAPGSNIVLDEYVYDPDRQTGDMALSLTRGTLRIIGGRITKKTDAIVRTPTATVGIRGGMAIIEVDENGDTKVILIAGEYVSITGPDGQVIYLSRPNAWAESTGQSGLQFAGLIPPEILKEIYSRFEGRGDGSSASAAAAAALAKIEEGLRGLNNADEEGGERRQPVSTSGESPEDDRTEGDNEEGETTFVDLTFFEPQTPEGPGDEGPPPPPTVGLPGGGAFASAGTGHTGFDGIGQGSIIGFSGSNIVVEAVFPNPDIDTLDPTFGFGEQSFFAQTQSPGAGFFDFNVDENNPIVEQDLVLETETVLGPNEVLPALGGDLRSAEYFGFADPAQEFFLVQFNAEPNGATSAPPVEGQFFFGNASPNQAVLGPDLAQGSARSNTVGEYVIEPNVRDFAPSMPGERLLVIANGGESRFKGTGTFIDPAGAGAPTIPGTGGPRPGGIPITGEPVFGGGVVVVDPNAPTGPDGNVTVNTQNISLDLLEANGGRVLSGEARNDDSGSNFQVFAQPIAENGPGGLSFGGTSFGTFFDGESFGYRVQNFGTLEDNDGNTVFGSEDNYIIVSSFFRQDGLPGNAYQFGPGETTLLFDPVFTLENDLSQNLLTRDPSSEANRIVTDPLALVQSPSAGFLGPDDGFVNNDRFAMFNAGLTICSNGDCGDEFNDALDVTGSYGQRTRAGNLSELTFHTGQVTGPDDNGLLFRISTNPTQFSNLPGTNVEQRASFTYGRGVEVSDTSGAYLSDDIFGFSELDVDFSTSRTDVGPADISLASSGLAGTAGLVDPADNRLEFLRWGYWSTRYDGGGDREDLVHMGFFTAGTLPLIENLPTDIAVSYAGVAIGTDNNLGSGPPVPVVGDFNMNYDFGTQRGTMTRMAIAGFNFTNAQLRGLTSDPRQYVGSEFLESGSLRVDGAFVASPGFAAGATIGSFQISDGDVSGREVVGVYGGAAVPE